MRLQQKHRALLSLQSILGLRLKSAFLRSFFLPLHLVHDSALFPADFVTGVKPMIFEPLSKIASTTSVAILPLLFLSFALFLPCNIPTSVALAAIVTVALIIATPATEPAPQVTQVTTVAVTTAAVTATTAAAFFIHPKAHRFRRCALPDYCCNKRTDWCRPGCLRQVHCIPVRRR